MGRVGRSRHTNMGKTAHKMKAGNLACLAERQRAFRAEQLSVLVATLPSTPLNPAIAHGISQRSRFRLSRVKMRFSFVENRPVFCP